MKNLLSKRLILSIFIVFFTISCGFSAQAAEKKKVTYTGKTKKQISREDVHLDDVPKHKISQFLNIASYTNSDPDFGTSESWVYGHSDSVAGNGTHRGYTISNFKNGDKAYFKWEGTHKTTVKEGGVWEMTLEGKTQVTGGTGKFKNIKGEGVYKNTITAKGDHQTGEFEVEY